MYRYRYIDIDILSGRALTRPGTLHARMLCYVNREPMTPDVTWS